MRQLDEAEIRGYIRQLHEEADTWRRSQAENPRTRPGQALRSAVASGLRRAAETIDAVRPEDHELQVIP